MEPSDVGIPDCVICQEPLCTEAIVALACGHVFHMHCVVQWLVVTPRPSCPHCRLHASKMDSRSSVRGGECAPDAEAKKGEDLVVEDAQVRIVGLERQLSKLKKKLTAASKIKDDTMIKHDELLKRYEEALDENKAIVMGLRMSEARMTEEQMQRERLRTDLRILDKKYREVQANLAAHKFVHEDDDETSLMTTLSNDHTLHPIRRAEIQLKALSYVKRELVKVSRRDAENQDSMKTMQESIESLRTKLFEAREDKRVLKREVRSLQMKLRRSGGREKEVGNARVSKAAAEESENPSRQHLVGGVDMDGGLDAMIELEMSGYEQAAKPPQATPRRARPPLAGLVGLENVPVDVDAATPAKPRIFDEASLRRYDVREAPDAEMVPDSDVEKESNESSGGSGGQIVILPPLPREVYNSRTSSAGSSLVSLQGKSLDSSTSGSPRAPRRRIVMPKRPRPPEFSRDIAPLVLPLQGRHIQRPKMKPVRAVGALDKYMRKS